jgi:peptidyl-prolyl cis-trans isomerase D
MAAIGAIRKRSGLLVGAIALSIVLFLLGDAVNNQFGVLKGGRSSDAGRVNGEAIPYQDFEKQVSESVKAFETQNRTSVNDMQRSYLSQQAWETEISKRLMGKTSEKTGLTVSDDEMVALTTTENAHQYIKQQFSPQGGEFNPYYVKDFLKSRIDLDDKGMEPGTRRRAWNEIVNQVEKSQLNSKYSNLIAKAMNATPTWMAEMYYTETNKSADLRFVQIPYSDINDNEVKVTDDELKSYLSKNSAKFSREEEVRKIQYAAFDIAPSAIDSLATLKYLSDKIEDFKKGTKKSEDSLFVKIYSELPFEDLYRTREQLAGSMIADSALRLPVGTVLGPIVENGMYKYVKVAAKKGMSDSVRVREVTFSFAQVKTEQEQKTRIAMVDSIYKAIDSLGTDLGAVAATYSDDPISKANGGNIGWVKIADPSKDEQYKGIIFHNGIAGKAYRYVDAQNNALKIIQIVEERPIKEGVKLANFARSIIPSQETENGIYSSVNQFVSTYSSETKFKEYAKAHPEIIKTAGEIKKSSFDIQGLGIARSLVKWAYAAKRGDISPIKTLDKKHVVAYLEAITGKGTPDLESVKDQVRFAYLQDKKYELLAKKIADTKSGSIDELASKMSKTVMDAPHAIFANTYISTGNEPAVVAAGIYLATNKLSAPIKGTNGVYVVVKTAGTDPPKATDLAQSRMMAGQVSASKARGATDALKKIAIIDDYRLNFEGGN